MSFSQFIKPYPDGYEDFEVGGTPVTAEILNTNYDGFLLGLNEFLPELAGMVEANPSESATAGNLTKLKVGNSIYLIPSGGSGGSTVEWEQLQLTGTKIATITIDNVPVDVYAPSGGGSGDEVEWTQTIRSGTKIGTITINGNPTDVYAPTPIDVEANPSGSATAGDLTKLKVGSSIYSIPSGGSGGSGHTILDDDGTALAQEDDLQFKGVYSVDNSEDGVTEVNVYREMTKSEFNALSSDEKKGFIRVTDEPDIYSDGHFQPIIYSTEEREIGVWTDGKPLYQKTLSIPTSSQNTTYDASSLNIDTCVKIDAFMSGNGSVPDGYWYSSSNYVSVNYYDGDLFINAPTQYSNNSPCIVTLQYTKSTDTAGSGSWTPQGVPTHKYSTDEHIVGTWIDGSTLYEKTYDFSSNPISIPSGSNFMTSDIDSSNIGVVTNVFANHSDGTLYNDMSADPTGNNHTKLKLKSVGGATAYYLTLQYTKSS